ncbi:MAG: ribonuclease Y [Chloroflexi bacterium]|nr:ribonuclease Y [Chloroflexota bacterium]
MESIVVIIAIAIGVGLLGTALGFFGRQAILMGTVRSTQREAEKALLETAAKQKELLVEAKEKAVLLRTEAEAELRERRQEQQRLERRLTQKEENLERKLESLEQKERNLAQKEKETQQLHQQMEGLKTQQLEKLEAISGMSSAEAKGILMHNIEEESQLDIARRLREMEARLKEEGDQIARDILSQAIQRLATDVVGETTVTVVPIPSDDMKGRLIGREGRNIRALEAATGVDLIIDDTPESVILSSFDSVRREIARVALNKLILDGRIHPARIEEMVGKARTEVEATIKAEGEDAAYKSGVHGLHPELIKLLGRLKYRTSYGQNVLMHSIEVAHISGMLAAELKANVKIAKAAGLLHDLGKAVDHEVEGPHAAIGADLVQRFGRSPEIVKAIAGHHGEAGPNSVEGFIVAAADAISGGRPGARRESLDHYVKRLEALESVANSFAGVEKSYAIQAGREVRIMVKPEQVDDLSAMRLARDIVKKIEETMEYPGQIKVTVIRETRAVEIAK